jgi:hypothetical protein
MNPTAPAFIMRAQGRERVGKKLLLVKKKNKKKKRKKKKKKM